MLTIEKIILRNGKKRKVSLDIIWVLGKVMPQDTFALGLFSYVSSKFLTLVWVFSWKERYILGRPLMQQLANLYTISFNMCINFFICMVVRMLWSRHSLAQKPFYLCCWRPPLARLNPYVPFCPLALILTHPLRQQHCASPSGLSPPPSFNLLHKYLVNACWMPGTVCWDSATN